MFFVFCICAVAVYTTFIGLLRRDISLGESRNILLLLIVGAFFALYPDITAAYNILVHGTLEHALIGKVPTHSLLFSFSAILFGAIIGYLLHYESERVLYMGLFTWSASLSHLLLDDLSGVSINYLYPISDRTFNVLSYMDRDLTCTNLLNYMLASYVVVIYIAAVIMIALLALDHLGFDFRSRNEN